jgi:tyrosinase
MQVNLGPSHRGVIDTVPKNPRDDFLGYNPRCLRRDVNKIPAAFTATNYTVDLIKNHDNITSFQFQLQGLAYDGNLGVHIGGHFTVGGDPGGDFFASPGEPSFHLHHAMLDRVWWIWQNQDIVKRQNAINGTITMNNDPPSRAATLDDDTDIGLLGPKIKLRDLMSTTGGKMCYVYE